MIIKVEAGGMITIERDKILAAMCDQFMEPDFTNEIEWLELDGTLGVTFIPLDVVGRFDHERLDDQDYIQEMFDDYYASTIQTVAIRKGYGARLSASGYMDCTDWSVFATLDGAKDYIVEMYGDDVEIDEDKDEAETRQG
jgi:hypothetical protein